MRATACRACMIYCTAWADAPSCRGPDTPNQTRGHKRSGKKNLPQAVREIASAHPDKRIQLWEEDEARFGQQGTLTRVWAPRGSRPPAVRQTEYGYLYVLGAACPATGQTSGLLAPVLNTEVVNLFLAQLSQELDDDIHAVLLWDQAGYHTAKNLHVPDNLTLLPLPPYSPELNPVENLWHYLRSHFWSNRLYPNYDALLDAAEHAWKQVCLTPTLIQSICAAPYLESCNI